jgi:hypothetical protein
MLVYCIKLLKAIDHLGSYRLRLRIVNADVAFKQLHLGEPQVHDQPAAAACSLQAALCTLLRICFVTPYYCVIYGLLYVALYCFGADPTLKRDIAAATCFPLTARIQASEMTC